jgi:hypothetical protein
VKRPVSWSLQDDQVSIRTLFGIDIPLVFASSWPGLWWLRTPLVLLLTLTSSSGHPFSIKWWSW